MDVDIDVDEEIESDIERRIKQSQENIEKLTRASLSTFVTTFKTEPTSRLPQNDEISFHVPKIETNRDEMAVRHSMSLDMTSPEARTPRHSHSDDKTTESDKKTRTSSQEEVSILWTLFC